MNVCDDCLTAVCDEGPGLDADEQSEMAAEFGADIADHRCEQFDGGDPCDCACYGGPNIKHDQTEEITVDESPSPTCPACGGVTYALGTLGTINWKRCRNCVMDSS